MKHCKPKYAIPYEIYCPFLRWIGDSHAGRSALDFFNWSAPTSAGKSLDSRAPLWPRTQKAVDMPACVKYVYHFFSAIISGSYHITPEFIIRLKALDMPIQLLNIPSCCTTSWNISSCWTTTWNIPSCCPTSWYIPSCWVTYWNIPSCCTTCWISDSNYIIYQRV